MGHDLSMLTLVKGDERYVYLFDADSRDEVIDRLRDAAADPSRSLSWFDATTLIRRVRQAGASRLEARPDAAH